MWDKNLSDEEILKTLRITVAGVGNLPINTRIWGMFKELTTEYYYTEEELLSDVVEYINSKNIVRKQNVKLGTFFNGVVFNYYSNFVDKERNYQKRVKAVSSFGKARLYGQYNNYILDNYTDNVTPESDLIDKQFIDITHNYFSPLELDCLLGFRTRKDSAEMTGKNYKYYCNRLNQNDLPPVIVPVAVLEFVHNFVVV